MNATKEWKCPKCGKVVTLWSSQSIRQKDSMLAHHKEVCGGELNDESV
jgi:predicted RNA-binding Zn-ribbon protein involved in translation (DUF1610 family)